MTKQKGKRAVIISNIKSETIEQAIFILKTPSYEQSAAGSSIVAEAQQIINSYIQTMEKIHPECRGRLRKRNFIMTAAVALSAFALTLLLVLMR